MAADKLYYCFETGAGFPDAAYTVFVSANNNNSVIYLTYFLAEAKFKNVLCPEPSILS